MFLDRSLKGPFFLEAIYRWVVQRCLEVVSFHTPPIRLLQALYSLWEWYVNLGGDHPPVMGFKTSQCSLGTLVFPKTPLDSPRFLSALDPPPSTRTQNTILVSTVWNLGQVSMNSSFRLPCVTIVFQDGAEAQAIEGRAMV